MFQTHPVPMLSLTAGLMLAGTALGDDYQIAGFAAEVSAEASGSHFPSGDSDFEQIDDSASTFGELPLLVSASAATAGGGGSGSADVQGTHDPDRLTVSCSGGGSGYGAGFEGSGSGNGTGSFTLAFEVSEPVVSLVTLQAVGDGSGNIGIGSVVLLADGTPIGSADADGVLFDESIFEYTLLPGVAYKVTGYGAGGGFSDDGGAGGSDAYGSATFAVETLCAFSGTLALGENAFDTTDAQGSNLDLTGLCDPGPFGNDVLHAAEYFRFTPDASTRYVLSTCGTAAFDTRIAVLADDCDPESVVACLDDSEGCAGFTTELSVDLEAGTTYTVVLGGYDPAAFGVGIVSIAKVPLAFTVPELGGTVHADAFADFFGCNGQPPESDSEVLEESPGSLSDLPISQNPFAGTCCSASASQSILLGVPSFNGLDINAQSLAAACPDLNSCGSASADAWVDVVFVVEVLEYSVATLDWTIQADFGGIAGYELLDPDGGVLVRDSSGSPAAGSFELELTAGTHRLRIETAAGATQTCGAPEPYGNIELGLSMVSIQVPGDLNGDGVIDGLDLALLLGSWGVCGGCPTDLNGDGVVDGVDLAILLGGWSG